MFTAALLAPYAPTGIPGPTLIQPAPEEVIRNTGGFCPGCLGFLVRKLWVAWYRYSGPQVFTLKASSMAEDGRERQSCIPSNNPEQPRRSSTVVQPSYKRSMTHRHSQQRNQADPSPSSLSPSNRHTASHFLHPARGPGAGGDTSFRALPSLYKRFEWLRRRMRSVWSLVAL